MATTTHHITPGGNRPPKPLATKGDDRQDLDVLLTPVHKTLFVEDRYVNRSLMWFASFQVAR